MISVNGAYLYHVVGTERHWLASGKRRESNMTYSVDILTVSGCGGVKGVNGTAVASPSEYLSAAGVELS